MWKVVKEITNNLLSNSYHGKKTNKQSSIIQQQIKIELSKKKRQRKIVE